jgi:hypothetical protein
VLRTFRNIFFIANNPAIAKGPMMKETTQYDSCGDIPKGLLSPKPSNPELLAAQKYIHTAFRKSVMPGCSKPALHR